MNESSCIISSLNLYEFSQVNNNEMGVFISRDDDPQMYRDAYEEAQRIIRISDEVRISMEKVETTILAPKSEPGTKVESEKLTSSKLAKKLGFKTAEFIDKLTHNGVLEVVDNKHSLTKKGEQIGGEAKYSKRFGAYFIWPEDMTV